MYNIRGWLLRGGGDPVGAPLGNDRRRQFRSVSTTLQQLLQLHCILARYELVRPVEFII